MRRGSAEEPSEDAGEEGAAEAEVAEVSAGLDGTKEETPMR